MPKLSQKTLEKRFLCKHCQQTFRTRQGLSGHIQYKHKLKPKEDENPYLEMIIDAFKFRQRSEIAGFNKEQISEMAQILAYWYVIKGQVEDEHIKLNNSDLKTYLIVSMVQMRSNQWLYRKLATDLSEAMALGFTKLMEMIVASKI